jgi:hypothetical protein
MMNSYESIDPDFIPSEVAPTLSFANTHALRIDTNLACGPLRRREVTYPRPTQENAEIRDALMDQGLVMGGISKNKSKDYVSFSIPGSARPAKYDAPHSVEGPYSYGDTTMFTEMGFLLGKLFLAGNENPIVIDRAVGLNLGIVEFTRVNERKLLLVPGFELSLKPVLDDDVATEYYTKKLGEEFGRRFEANKGDFLIGFSDVFKNIVGPQ